MCLFSCCSYFSHILDCDRSTVERNFCDSKKENLIKVVIGTAHCRELGTTRSSAHESRKAMTSSPEKEDRYYTTRGSVGLDDHSKLLANSKEEKKKFVWPKLLVTLSSKEKEEDFLAMKGTKLPQRPKKRAKLIQRTILVSFQTHLIKKNTLHSVSHHLNFHKLSF